MWSFYADTSSVFFVLLMLTFSTFVTWTRRQGVWSFYANTSSVFFLLSMWTFSTFWHGLAGRGCVRSQAVLEGSGCPAHHPPRHRARPQSRPQLRSNHHQSDRIYVEMVWREDEVSTEIIWARAHDSGVWHTFEYHKFIVTQIKLQYMPLDVFT